MPMATIAMFDTSRANSIVARTRDTVSKRFKPTRNCS
jgi:hypothetical protein